MSLLFDLPPLKHGDLPPVWEGKGFRIGNDKVSVLEYNTNEDGWTDELTDFHNKIVGSDHFIDRASRQYALRQLIKYVKDKSPIILEVGCSSGFMLQMMHAKLPNAFILGSDVISGALRHLAARMPDIPLFQFDLVHCPLPDQSVNAVILLNVLEHIDDDRAAIMQVNRLLKKDGIAIIEVPAGPHLYDIYDKLLLHRRRYTLSGLTELIHKSGFSILKMSHLGFFLYPGFWLIKKRNKRLLSLNKSVSKQIVKQNIEKTGNSRILEVLIQFELLIGRWLSYPFGIRCLLTCIKL
jgi:SAM-dependent methyltransferase